MRAMAFTDFGATPTLTELPVPEPGPEEVLVRVRSSSVNGFDLGVLGGHLAGVYTYEFPVVLGKDFAGVVAAIGTGVTGLRVDDPVFGVVMRPTLGQGGFAEYVVVAAHYGLAKTPEGLDHVRAGALGLAGTAALNAVDAIAPGPGETVLICGATGGVGAWPATARPWLGCSSEAGGWPQQCISSRTTDAVERILTIDRSTSGGWRVACSPSTGMN
ncbi:alcohol dehydrogenase catalytic domain-containing protein [Phytohabitans aurantiacus]|jgi:NADPH:quinone reductase-like Zn-dependent oxidoreductase|uniref:Alcohol dehydrogenase-like N-terminal domain-containing protein n=1 Tax=Phytohabitans aurantiacus TaxID=3016789 RepID=A0ABQ5R3D7_9ACTN|nr:alcohol dehydrogenase catalytic domain-containing protein [Phytohabitans aurantiacus]GLI01299.1 hypothetical protein Pa4123_65750 [Phytohabitans aurantiacus]